MKKGDSKLTLREFTEQAKKVLEEKKRDLRFAEGVRSATSGIRPRRQS